MENIAHDHAFSRPVYDVLNLIRWLVMMGTFVFENTINLKGLRGSELVSFCNCE